MAKQKVKIQVPATTANLGPGFDVLGMALGIYNTVEMTLDNSSFAAAEVTGEGAGLLSRTGSKLIMDAARAVFDAAGRPTDGIHIRQHNRIPLFRGMGSSAAAIAGGMAAANALLPQPLPPEEILQLATRLEGHPDNVAPALFGGFVAVCRNGDQVRHIRIEPPPGLNVVVLVPAFTLPTKKSRSLLPAQVPLEDAVFNVGHASVLVAALCTGDLELLSFSMEDRLHQTYRSALVPGLAEVVAAAKKEGALAAALSGAGPAVVAFTTENDDAIGEAMRHAFLQHDVTSRVILTGIGRRGALDSASFSG
ncbi:MAG: homoserine kinase [Bacillota bacterium]|nr:homoserine kinase [Bacillota bacterium]MDW7683664.1 homoserine kinase [Bacillota bacterium]